MDDFENLSLDLTLDLVVYFDILKDDLDEEMSKLSKDLERSCVDKPHVEILHTGSSFERLALPHINISEGSLMAWNTDADHMMIRTDIKVLQSTKESVEESVENPLLESDVKESVSEPQSSEGEEDKDGKDASIRFIYDASHAGYALTSFNKLPMTSCVDSYYLKTSDFIEESKEMIPHHDTAMMALSGSITGPSYSLPYIGGTFIVHRDFVYGLKCNFWPSQAKEWAVRDRTEAWPNCEVIDDIIAKGCHIVPVGSHTSSLREFEWRYSFSVAELKLISSLTDNQRLAFAILKALIKSEMKMKGIDVFSSYHLKTSLLWFFEKNGVISWEKGSLGSNILELLDFLTAFYAEGFLPNYFISNNNMIDHRSADEIQKTCSALKDIRANFTLSLCRYIETNQKIPVLFDKPLSELLKDSASFTQMCKYNFLVMSLAYIMKDIQKVGYTDNIGVMNCSETLQYLVNKALSLNKTNSNEYLADCSSAENVLSIIEEFLGVDQLKVTETSAVALAIFNVFLTFHPTSLNTFDTDINSMDINKHFDIPAFKESLFCAARLHEKYCDVIYDFVVKEWKNGPQFHTEDEKAKQIMKLLMVVLGKPTKQAIDVTGCLIKRVIEGQRFIMMRSLAEFLLLVHPESAYVAFQAAAYLMDTTVLSEMLLISNIKVSKLRAVELALSKAELVAQLSEKEFDNLVKEHHELMS